MRAAQRRPALRNSFESKTSTYRLDLQSANDLAAYLRLLQFGPDEVETRMDSSIPATRERLGNHLFQKLQVVFRLSPGKGLTIQ